MALAALNYAIDLPAILSALPRPADAPRKGRLSWQGRGDFGVAYTAGDMTITVWGAGARARALPSARDLVEEFAESHDFHRLGPSPLTIATHSVRATAGPGVEAWESHLNGRGMLPSLEDRLTLRQWSETRGLGRRDGLDIHEIGGMDVGVQVFDTVLLAVACTASPDLATDDRALRVGRAVRNRLTQILLLGL